MASRGVSLRRGDFASVVLSELCGSAYLCERIFWPHAESAESAEACFCVGVCVRTLRLCAFCESFSVGLTWRTLRARRFVSVVLSELCGSVLSARGSGCRGFRTISEVIDDAFDAVFKY